MTSSPSLTSLPWQHGQADGRRDDDALARQLRWQRRSYRLAARGAAPSALVWAGLRGAPRPPLRRRTRPHWRLPPAPRAAAPAGQAAGAGAPRKAPNRSRFSLAISSFRWATIASAPDVARARGAARSARNAAFSVSKSSGTASGELGSRGAIKSQNQPVDSPNRTRRRSAKRLNQPALRTEGVTRVPPINSVEHVSELRWRIEPQNRDKKPAAEIKLRPRKGLRTPGGGRPESHHGGLHSPFVHTRDCDAWLRVVAYPSCGIGVIIRDPGINQDYGGRSRLRGLVPRIHAAPSGALPTAMRGWPGQSPAMTIILAVGTTHGARGSLLPAHHRQGVRTPAQKHGLRKSTFSQVPMR